MSMNSFVFFFGISLNYSAISLKMRTNSDKISEKIQRNFSDRGVHFGVTALRTTRFFIIFLRNQVGFAELKEPADDGANIGGSIVVAPIIGQWSAQYILTDHQDAECSPMIGLILSRQLLICLYQADFPANIVSPIILLLVLDWCSGYYRSTNLCFIKARPILSLLFIHQPWIFNICTLVGPSFDRNLLSQCWTDNQATLHQPIFNLLKLR